MRQIEFRQYSCAVLFPFVLANIIIYKRTKTYLNGNEPAGYSMLSATVLVL